MIASLTAVSDSLNDYENDVTRSSESHHAIDADFLLSLQRPVEPAVDQHVCRPGSATCSARN